MFYFWFFLFPQIVNVIIYRPKKNFNVNFNFCTKADSSVHQSLFCNRSIFCSDLKQRERSHSPFLAWLVAKYASVCLSATYYTLMPKCLTTTFLTAVTSIMIRWCCKVRTGCNLFLHLRASLTNYKWDCHVIYTWQATKRLYLLTCKVWQLKI